MASNRGVVPSIVGVRGRTVMASARSFRTVMVVPPPLASVVKPVAGSTAEITAVPGPTTTSLLRRRSRWSRR